MNKKGFTLVELIGVVVILSVLIILITTNLTGIMKETNDNLDKSTRKVLYVAAEEYLDKYETVKPNGSYVVTLNNLITKDIISSNFIDTNKEKLNINSCVVVKYTNGYAENKFDYNCDARNFSEAILSDNTLVTSAPTLTTTSEEANENGLYSSTATNSGDPTYYFRGNVENNYVYFAGQMWRIVRINEDGTIRLIMQDGINDNKSYSMNLTSNNYDSIYYSNSDTKPIIENWYNLNLSKYSDYLTISSFCEQAKVKLFDNYTSGNVTMQMYDEYNASENINFKCSTDANGYGILSLNVGLLTYEEAVYAGAYPDAIVNYYLKNDTYWWSMSPAGYGSFHSPFWSIGNNGHISIWVKNHKRQLRPVINLDSTVNIVGKGTSDNPYLVVMDK